MSNGNYTAEAVTLQGDMVVTSTVTVLTQEGWDFCEALVEQIRSLARKQAHIRLAECRKLRQAALSELETLLNEEQRLSAILEAIPADQYAQNIWDAFPHLARR